MVKLNNKKIKDTIKKFFNNIKTYNLYDRLRSSNLGFKEGVNLILIKQNVNIITYKVFQYKGDTYLICWVEENYTNIHLYKKTNKDFKEVYEIYDSTIKDKIGSCEDYYIKATEFVMELYEDKVKKDTFKENQKKKFEEWEGVIE